MKADSVVTRLLDDVQADPHARKVFDLEYRPYREGEDWRWFWVLHPENKQRAVYHGEARNRSEASIQARIQARKLGGVIRHVILTQ